MRTTQSDYIIRLIEQLGLTLRRLRAKLSGGEPGGADEVMRESADAQADLFGPLWEVIHRLDTHTAVSLIPEKERITGWMELLILEAEAARASGDQVREAATSRRAAELKAELDGRSAAESRLNY